MILFMDTSALLKRYLQEEGSDMIRAAIESDGEVVISVLTYVEIHSAVSRRTREKSILESERKTILSEFETDWLHFGKVPLDDFLLNRAGTLCLEHPIRSLIALHIPSALTISENREESFVFLTADERLRTAA